MRGIILTCLLFGVFGLAGCGDGGQEPSATLTEKEAQTPIPPEVDGGPEDALPQQ